MNDKIRQHLTEYNLRQGYGVSEDTLIETLFNANRVYEAQKGEHRWWTDVFVVAEVDGMLIGFLDAYTTGDNSPREIGWEFNPDSICEVAAKVITKTIYERIPD